MFVLPLRDPLHTCLRADTRHRTDCFDCDSLTAIRKRGIQQGVPASVCFCAFHRASFSRLRSHISEGDSFPALLQYASLFENPRPPKDKRCSSNESYQTRSNGPHRRHSKEIQEFVHAFFSSAGITPESTTGGAGKGCQ